MYQVESDSTNFIQFNYSLSTVHISIILGYTSETAHYNNINQRSIYICLEIKYLYILILAHKCNGTCTVKSFMNQIVMSLTWSAERLADYNRRVVDFL